MLSDPLICRTHPPSFRNARGGRVVPAVSNCTETKSFRVPHGNERKSDTSGVRRASFSRFHFYVSESLARGSRRHGRRVLPSTFHFAPLRNERKRERGKIPRRVALGAHPSGDGRQQEPRVPCNRNLIILAAATRNGIQRRRKRYCTYTCVYYYLLTTTRLTSKIFWLKYFIEARL